MVGEQIITWKTSHDSLNDSRIVEAQLAFKQQILKQSKDWPEALLKQIEYRKLSHCIQNMLNKFKVYSLSTSPIKFNYVSHFKYKLCSVT